MISEYHRPKTVEEALALLARPDLSAQPLAGGTVLSQPSREPRVLVDLQDLQLDSLEVRGNAMAIGAMVRLATLYEYDGTTEPLRRIIALEAGHNLRQAASVAGTLVSADGRSPLACAFLSLNASLKILPGEDEIPLGDILPLRREMLAGRLIVEISLPTQPRLGYEQVARTPADRPLVSAAVATWPSGRTRVALGGYGEHPWMVFDAPQDAGAEIAARDAYSHASDEWASGDYRAESAGILVRRLLKIGEFGGVKPGVQPT